MTLLSNTFIHSHVLQELRQMARAKREKNKRGVICCLSTISNQFHHRNSLELVGILATDLHHQQRGGLIRTLVGLVRRAAHQRHK